MPGVPPPPVRIRDLTEADEAAGSAAVERSRALHAPWQQLADSHERWEQLLDRLALPSYACLLVESVPDLGAGDGGLVGFVNVSDIVRGAFQSAYLGYAAFVPKPCRPRAVLCRPAAGGGPLLLDAGAAPGGGERAAGQRAVEGGGAAAGLPAGGALPAVPVGRRRLAGPRAVGGHRRGVAAGRARRVAGWMAGCDGCSPPPARTRSTTRPCARSTPRRIVTSGSTSSPAPTAR